MDKAGLHIGAIAFIHRFGSSLNEHVHFHVCVVDGVFEEVEGEGDADATPRISSPGVIFHAATGIDAATVAPVQTTLQKRILRAFVARGLLENCDAKDMLGYKHSGFSVDAGVCIEAHDRAALERLLRYCARPPFSMERLLPPTEKRTSRRAGAHRGRTAPAARGGSGSLRITPLAVLRLEGYFCPSPKKVKLAKKQQNWPIQIASKTCISTCRPAAAAIFTKASSPKRLILPRIKSDTRG
jgi:hypothetical protein